MSTSKVGITTYIQIDLQVTTILQTLGKFSHLLVLDVLPLPTMSLKFAAACLV
jgi:hypothetical protein